MSQSDDIAAQTQALYVGPAHAYDEPITDYLDRNPLMAAQTYPSTSGAPDSTWDSTDTAGVGKNFGVGFFVQDESTGGIYRCFDATPGAAQWQLITQEMI